MENLRILKGVEVDAMTGLKRSSRYAYVKAGKFPAPIKLGARSVGWLEHEIQEWLNDRISKSRGGV